MSFNIGLSGLYAANKQLDVTGNNIANVATTGFKSSRAEFEDVYSASKLGTGSKTIGNGVNLANVPAVWPGRRQQHRQRAGHGHPGQRLLRPERQRRSELHPCRCVQDDKDGYVTNNTGTSRLQGYGVDANGKIINGVLTDLRSTRRTWRQSHQQGGLDHQPELLVGRDRPGGHAVRPEETSSYSTQFSTTFTTPRATHPMDQYLVKTGTNTWNIYTLIDGRNPDGIRPPANAKAPVAST
jgi:flagellar hook protein FlgE